jgi:D-sedoheptulose 7-phosphate isomerase
MIVLRAAESCAPRGNHSLQYRKANIPVHTLIDLRQVAVILGPRHVHQHRTDPGKPGLRFIQGVSLKNPDKKLRDAILLEIDESAETTVRSREIIATAVLETAPRCVQALQSGSKILIAGNGGSAADAQHFAAELTGRYRRDRKGLAAIALTTDTSFLTAWTNDVGYDAVFSRQLEAIGNSGDIFIGISTSGNSGNILEAINKAKELGITTIFLTGESGGSTHGLADIEVNVPARETSRIQEIHILFFHLLAEHLDECFSSAESE